MIRHQHCCPETETLAADSQQNAHGLSKTDFQEVSGESLLNTARIEMDSPVSLLETTLLVRKFVSL